MKAGLHVLQLSWKTFSYHEMTKRSIWTQILDRSQGRSKFCLTGC